MFLAVFHVHESERILTFNPGDFVLSSKLYNQVKDKNLTELLCEYDDIHEKRSNLEKTVKELQGAKSLIHSII